jgi:hypothetical protein
MKYHVTITSADTIEVEAETPGEAQEIVLEGDFVFQNSIHYEVLDIVTEEAPKEG